MNVCQHFFIVIHAKTHFVFGLLLCKIPLEKNQHVSGLEFTYNNWQKEKKKKKSCQMLTCLVFIFVLGREIVVVLCFPLLKG